MPSSFSLPPFPIGLGLAALGRPSYLTIGHAEDVGGHPDRYALGQQAGRMIDQAWDHGIRYFDVARSYGMAESFLAEWLAANGVHQDLVVVGSKWGYTYTAAWKADATIHEVKDHSAGVLHRQLAESRINLGHHLHLYQIHSASVTSGVLEDHAVVSQLWSLRDQGLAVGITTSGPTQAATIEAALEVTRDNVQLFSTVQATWNLLEPSAGPALSAASEAGLQIIVKEAVANGRLTPRAALLPEHAVAGFSSDALAIAACLAQPWCAVTLSGATTREQLRSNLSALEVPATAIEGLPDIAEEPDVYWAKRSELAWT